MKNYKQGFTLAEVLVSLAVISVILALSVNAISIARASYTSLAYFAHKNLSNMVGIVYSGPINGSTADRTECTTGNAVPGVLGKKCPEKKEGADKAYYYKYKGSTQDLLTYKSGTAEEDISSSITYCSADGKQHAVLMNDYEYHAGIGAACSARPSSGDKHNIFCKSLAAVSNTAGKPDCSSSALFAVTGASSSAEPQFTSLNLDKPNFTLTNGMRFYISEWKFDSTNVSPVFGYRLVGIDLNGKGEPNSTTLGAKAKPADVVTFMVLDNGEVYPLGNAADNVKDGKYIVQYLNSKVKGYYYSKYSSYTPGKKASDGSNGNPKVSRDDTVRLPECVFMDGKVDSAGNPVPYNCNLGLVYLQNPHADSVDKSKALSYFTYRQALCSAKGESSKGAGDSMLGYEKYCSLGSKASSSSPYLRNAKCPPPGTGYGFCADETSDSSKCTFDQCKVENIKPVFRYNFN